MAFQFDSGFRRVVDSAMNATQAGTPVFLRIQNFVAQDQQTYDQLGFQIAPVSGPTGTTDIRIFPQPTVRMLSMKEVAFLGGRLLAGAREFLVSQTWTWKFMNAHSMTDPSLVFLGSQTLGLVMSERLFNIIGIEPEWMGTGIVLWRLTCSAHEPTDI